MAVVSDDRIMLNKCSRIDDAVVTHPGAGIDDRTVHHDAARANGCMTRDMGGG